jgi:hypothetical protein
MIGAIKSDIRNCRDLIVFPRQLGHQGKNIMSASMVTGREHQSSHNPSGVLFRLADSRLGAEFAQ